MRALSITGDDVDTLTSDGRVVHIRDIRPTDRPELLALQDRASERSIYLRYFSANREQARRYAAGLAEPDEHRHALGAFTGSTLIGMAVYERQQDNTAEFALMVDDPRQHSGIGTLLLEHLIAEARGAGVKRFVAEVLATNSAMLQVMRDLGFTPATHTEYGETHVEFELELSDVLVEAISQREQTANAASLRPLMSPSSIVVVGAGGRPRTVGHEVLRNVLDAGFTGRVSAVNPNRRTVLGVPCYPTPLDLPEAPELAIIALPAGLVPDAVRACGERGCRAAVVLGAGFSEAGPDGAKLQEQVVAIAREHGMRLVGPNCLGIVNTDPQIRLDGTFALLPRRAGGLSVFAQSGAFGAAVLRAADQLGAGMSQFVSLGNKADVGGNELLLLWEQDPRTTVIGAYLESVGDPRRFARIASRVSRSKPIVAIKSGRTEAGQRAGLSHTAAAASSDVAIDALFRSCGVLRVGTIAEMLDVARVLDAQPLPRGPRVAIVGNSGGPEILAADAAVDAGLIVTDFDAATCDTLRKLGVPTQNPIDLGAAATAETLGAVLQAVVDSSSVDAVIAVFTDIAITDVDAVREAITTAAGQSDKPFVFVAFGQPAGTLPLRGTTRTLPVFSFPEPAAGALGLANRYRCLKEGPRILPVRPSGIDAGAARAVVQAALDDGRAWLSPTDVATVLRTFGVEVCTQRTAPDADAAAAAAAEIGYPVVVKLAAAGLHKSDVGGVRLGIANEADLRAAVRELEAISAAGLLVQPMLTGTELIVGSVHDPQCGPLIMLGAGGVLTDILGDRAFALAPMTEPDAAALIDRLRSARLLDGYRGKPKASRAAVTDVLMRVAALVDEFPEIAELDLNPVVCTAERAVTVDARIRVAPPPYHPDPLVRQLR